MERGESEGREEKDQEGMTSKGEGSTALDLSTCRILKNLDPQHTPRIVAVPSSSSSAERYSPAVVRSWSSERFGDDDDEGARYARRGEVLGNGRAEGELCWEVGDVGEVFEEDEAAIVGGERVE
jgi:hypothetical protein